MNTPNDMNKTAIILIGVPVTMLILGDLLEFYGFRERQEEDAGEGAMTAPTAAG